MDADFIAKQIRFLPVGVVQILKDDEAYTITKTGELGWYLYHLSYEGKEIAVTDGGFGGEFPLELEATCQRLAEYISLPL